MALSDNFPLMTLFLGDTLYIVTRETLNLLGWNLKCCGPHVNLFIDVHTRNDKEHSRSPSPSGHQSTQSKNDSSFILLDNLKFNYFPSSILT